MKISSTLAALLLGALSIQGAQAANFTLSLDADNGSRWYDYYSDVYAQLGADWGVIENENSAEVGEHADGFYLIGSGAKVGSGAIVFPYGGDFDNIGTLSYNELTGAITGFTVVNGFQPYVADNDGLPHGLTGGAGYSTTLTGVSGSVTLVDGAVSAIDLVSTITFSYASYGYTGTFTINGDRFALNVDDTKTALGRTVRLAWDVDGGVAGLAAPVPEPTTYAMMGMGLLAVAGMARRRKQG